MDEHYGMSRPPGTARRAAPFARTVARLPASADRPTPAPTPILTNTRLSSCPALPCPDAIILGTGVTECVLSALLSVEGKKVLHMDRNSYYGGDMASLTLSQLYAKFRPGTPPPADLGRDRDWAVDLIPKLILSNGELTNMLVHTDVTRYLEFKQISASYVYRDGKIAKVPATETEAAKSPLMSLMEKTRARNFFLFIQGWRDSDPATHQGEYRCCHTLYPVVRPCLSLRSRPISLALLCGRNGQCADERMC